MCPSFRFATINCWGVSTHIKTSLVLRRKAGQEKRTTVKQPPRADYLSLQQTDHIPRPYSIFVPPSSGHLSDTDEPQTYLSQYKITFENRTQGGEVISGVGKEFDKLFWLQRCSLCNRNVANFLGHTIDRRIRLCATVAGSWCTTQWYAPPPGPWG